MSLCILRQPSNQQTKRSKIIFVTRPSTQVLEVFSELFIHIFDELNRNCKEEIEAVRVQHPFKDLRYARPTLRLTFQEGIQLLRDAGYDGKYPQFVGFSSVVRSVLRLGRVAQPSITFRYTVEDGTISFAVRISSVQALERCGSREGALPAQMLCCESLFRKTPSLCWLQLYGIELTPVVCPHVDGCPALVVGFCCLRCAHCHGCRCLRDMDTFFFSLLS